MNQVERTSLSQLNAGIKQTLTSNFSQPIWVVAEILEMQVNRSGHCYLEVVEKAEDDNRILARSRATIWSSQYPMIRSYFETTTRTTLKPGIKLLVKAAVNFHSVYGLSLTITDIDPNFTLGDIELRKQEILKKLQASGVMNMNRELELPEVPQRIAVISSETAAGLGDFIDSLVNNPYDFSFKVHIYPAIVQGEAAENSIIAAFESIYNSEYQYDLVALLRGGGSQADLDCFNSYDLAMNIAQFPIPVLTGIGHDRDETIADIVAHKNLKTPTAVAEYILDLLLDFYALMNNLEERFVNRTRNILQSANNRLLLHSQRLNDLWNGYSRLQKNLLITFETNLKNGTLRFLMKEKEKNTSYERNLEFLKPERVLNRGYAIAYRNGKVMKSLKGSKAGDDLEVQLRDGRFNAKLTDIKRNKS